MILKKIRYIFLLYALNFVYAASLEVGNHLPKMTLEDQFDKIHQVESANINMVIVSHEKDISGMVNDFLSKKKSDFLAKKRVIFISDIHKMPGFIASLFAIPKLQKLKYPILLLKNENEIFPKQKNALTILKLEKGAIAKVIFLKDKKELANIFGD